jgi:hypothetical protein
VCRALLDPEAVQRWMVPDGMTSEIHTFDGREGGAFRISLTYSLADAPGGGTTVTGLHEDVPPESPLDNELGWQISMAKLAALVESA